MSTSYPSIPVNDNTWRDVINGSIAGKKVMLQNIRHVGVVEVYIGGASAPLETEYGTRLQTFDAIEVTTDHIYVRGVGRLAVLEL